ncbi:galactonate dehydratase [Natrinema sp. 74]|uniref:galactonate dehydratase n=1 Tax=Natrinema sp. 74 TaxID=3384159 RepID=UPI0038D437DE
MRVTEYEFYEVPPRWQFLKLETDTGLVGWGEPYTKWHHVNDSPTPTRSAVDQLMQKYVLGADPARIEDCWQSMYRASFYRGGPIHMSAIAGIDEALWDLKGKAAGLPVYELLGGRSRDRIHAYQHVSVPHDADDPAAAAARDAETHVADGFTALKLLPVAGVEPVDDAAAVRRARDIVGAVREAVGPDIGIALDFHGRASRPMARRLAAAVDEFEPMFVEEPVAPEHDRALGRLADVTTAPLATGERYYSRWDVRPLFEAGSVDIIQPDVSSAGGITETKKIADAAATHDIAFAPHCPMGPIAVAASLHLDTVAPNALVQEQVLHTTEGAFRYVENPECFAITDGYFDVPSGPGLGVDVDEEALEAFDGTALAFERPVGRRADGSIGER